MRTHIRTTFAIRLLATLAPFACLSTLACQSEPTAHETQAVAAASVPPAPAAEPTEAEITARILELAANDNRVQDHLDHLTHAIGPRLTSSHNLMAAEEWAREQFASWGLDARLESWGEFAVGFDRGPWHGAMISPEYQELEFNTPAWTAGTTIAKRGRAILWPRSEEEIAALGDSLAGAWIVVPPFTREDRPDNDLRKKIDQSLEDAKVAGWVRRSFGRRGELLITDGNHDIQWAELPDRVEVRVRGDQYDALVERLKKPEEVVIEFLVDNRFYPGPVTQYNVVADLIGTEKPDEYVIVGGHIDSWDGAQGAQDNGTGVSTTLEAARLLAAAGARPKRTIRFVLFSGEEQGLFGSRGYVRDHADELPRISAVLVHDGGTNYVSGIRGTPEMEADLRAAFGPVMALDADMPFEVDVGEGLPNSQDSDHASYISKGVPGFFWQQTGKADYNHVHHTQFDTFETAVPEYQRHSAAVIAVGAWQLANLDHLLSRQNMEPLQPRRMGVQLEVTKLIEVNDGGVAAKAGLLVGDVILEIDGQPVTEREQISRILQKGAPQKPFKIQRGEQTLEVTLDWSDDPGEKRRVERAQARSEKPAAPAPTKP